MGMLTNGSYVAGLKSDKIISLRSKGTGNLK